MDDVTHASETREQFDTPELTVVPYPPSIPIISPSTPEERGERDPLHGLPQSLTLKDALVHLTRSQGKIGAAIFQIVAGVILIAVGIIAEQPELIALGVGLFLGGVAALLFPVKTPSFGIAQREDETVVYTFGGITNPQGQGALIPPVYGTHLVGGTIISAYVRPRPTRKWFRPISATGQGTVVGADGISRFVVRLDESIDYFQVAFLATFDQPVYGNWKCWWKPQNSSTWTSFGFADVREGELIVVQQNLGSYQSIDVGVSLHLHYKYTSSVTANFLWSEIKGRTQQDERSGKNTATINLTGSDVAPFSGIKATINQVTTPSSSSLSGAALVWATSSRTSFVNTYEFFIPPEPEELHLLISVAEGEIDNLYNVRLNGQLVTNFQNAFIEYRTGADQQAVLEGFEFIRSTTPINTDLSAGVQVVRTTVGVVDEMFLVFLFPTGLFRTDDHGNLQTLSVTVRVEYKKTTASTWTSAGDFTFSSNRRSAIKRYVSITPSEKGVTYDVRVTRLTENHTDSRRFSDLTWLEMQEIQHLAQTYPGTALLAVHVLATDEISGAVPNVTCEVKGLKCAVPHLQISGQDVEISDCYYDPVIGQYRRISDDTAATDTGQLVRQWTSNPFWHVWDFMTNPRYGVGGFLDINTDLDLARHKQEASFCDELVNLKSDGSIRERRFEQERVVDNQRAIWDIVLEMMNTCQGIPIAEGHVYIFRIDRKTVRSNTIFATRTIKDVESSFVRSYISFRQEYNAITVQYADREQQWALTPLQVEDQQLFASQESVIRDRQMNMIGVSKRSQIERRANRELKAARLIRQTASLITDWHLLGASVLDRVAVQSSFVKWGAAEGSAAAHVRSYQAPDTITLDTPITFDGSNTYELMIHHITTNTIETRNLASISGTVSSVTLDVGESFQETPSAGDMVVVGVRTLSTKDFRITAISKSPDGRCKVDLIEYNESVLDDIVPLSQTTSLVPVLNRAALIPSPVEDLRASVFSNDGRLSVIVSWVKPADGSYASANVYRSVDNEETFVFVANTPDAQYWDTNQVPGRTITYLVQSVGLDGRTLPLSRSPRTTIVVTTITRPPAPTGLRLYRRYNDASTADPFNTIFEGKHARFEWNPVASMTGAGLESDGAGSDDFADQMRSPYDAVSYRVEIHASNVIQFKPDGSSVLLGVPRRRVIVTQPEFTYTYEMNVEDSQTQFGTDVPLRSFTIMVWTIAASGAVSDRPAVLSVSNPQASPPISVTATAYEASIRVSWIPKKEADLAGYRVYQSQSSGFTPDATTLVYEGPDTSVEVRALGNQVANYFRVAAFDTFGTDSLIFSDEVSATPTGFLTSQLVGTIDALRLNTGSLQLFGATWVDNTPANGSVQWSNVSIQLDGTTYTIQDGSTGARWIYWQKGASSFSTSDAQFPVLTSNDYLIALNDSGTAKVLWDNPLKAGVLVGTLLATDFQLTQSSQIATAVINDAHITSLNASKIIAGTITADKFESTLGGDLNQALSFTKAMLEGSSEFTHVFSESDVQQGTFTDTKLLPEENAPPRPIRIGLVMTKHWDDGTTWDSGATWDVPVTTNLGIWESNDNTLDMTTNQTGQVEVYAGKTIENPGNGTKTIVVKATYQKDGSVTWGADEPDYTDGGYETLTESGNFLGTKTQWVGSVKSNVRKIRIRIELQTSVPTERVLIQDPEMRFNDVRIGVAQTNDELLYEYIGDRVYLSDSTPSYTLPSIASLRRLPYKITIYHTGPSLNTQVTVNAASGDSIRLGAASNSVNVTSTGCNVIGSYLTLVAYSGTEWVQHHSRWMFNSGEATLPTTNNQGITINHPLNAVPRTWIAVLRCKVAGHGYAVGDELEVASADDTSGNMYGSPYVNASVVSIVFSALRLRDRNTAVPFTLIPAGEAGNWKLVFHAEL